MPNSKRLLIDAYLKTDDKMKAKIKQMKNGYNIARFSPAVRSRYIVTSPIHVFGHPSEIRRCRNMKDNERKCYDRISENKTAFLHTSVIYMLLLFFFFLNWMSEVELEFAVCKVVICSGRRNKKVHSYWWWGCACAWSLFALRLMHSFKMSLSNGCSRYITMVIMYIWYIWICQ